MVMSRGLGDVYKRQHTHTHIHTHTHTHTLTHTHTYRALLLLPPSTPPVLPHTSVTSSRGHRLGRTFGSRPADTPEAIHHSSAVGQKASSSTFVYTSTSRRRRSREQQALTRGASAESVANTLRVTIRPGLKSSPPAFQLCHYHPGPTVRLLCMTSEVTSLASWLAQPSRRCW